MRRLALAGSAGEVCLMEACRTLSYRPRTSEAEGWVEDLLELTFEGQSPASLAAQQALLEALLAAEDTELRLQAAEGEPEWRSKLAGGCLEQTSPPGARARGLLGLRLRLQRADAWLGPAAELPLAGVSGGVEVTSGMSLSAGTAGGELPPALRLEMSNPNTDPLQDAGRVWVSTGSSPAVLLEAETASGGTLLSDLRASGGAYRRVNLPAGEEPLLTWALDGSLQGVFRALLLGTGFGLPLMGARSLRLQRRESDGSYDALAWQGGPSAPSALAWLDLGRLVLPPFRPGSLVLLGQQGAGSQADVDGLLLLPAASLRIYEPLAVQGAVGNGWTLVDDGIGGGLWKSAPGGGLYGGYRALGGPLSLPPASAQQMAFFFDDAAGSPQTGMHLRVRLWAAPRVRMP
ncbi:MAG TPA: hypothetical protein PKW33_20095 [Anaerolineaceae bacterium]|nr:hypothetical protein [Anaerolineaceae bacterium]HPN53908.1 hypothetical protein [Anaerolineaceae bacterium]